MGNNPKYSIGPKEYSKRIAGIELKSINLVGFSAKRNIDINLEMDYDFRITENHRFENIDEGTVYIFSTYEIQRFEVTNPENMVCDIKLEFVTAILSEFKFTRNFFSVFKKLNLPLNLWPYVRSYTQFLTQNMGLTPTVLPYWKKGIKK